MKTNRRHILGIGAAALAVATLSGCETIEQRLTRPALPSDALPPADAAESLPAARLLNRLAYGPRPGDVARVASIGQAAYVDEQLAPETINESPTCDWRVRSLNDVLDADAGLLFDIDDRRALAALRQATLLRAVYSDRQLQERLAGFWTDHFNVSAHKGAGTQWSVISDRDVIRAHALGKFRDLLGASARSAAMLEYLDNTANKRGMPNENYARELMELHTMGVDGGYTQSDVHQVARCLTGWTFQTHWHRGGFLFDPSVHDDGPKVVLGQSIPPGGGIRDGERVLDILASHPATARHLSRKLCVFFLGHAPDAWVRRLSQVYLATGGDIRAMLRPLLHSQDLLDAPPILKRPLDYAASALRATNADTDGGIALQSHMDAMGQPLFAWPMPDGFPTRAAAWTGALIPRWNFALQLASGQIDGTRLDPSWLASHSDALNMALEYAFGCPAAHPSLAALRGRLQCVADAAPRAALIFMSPEFQWR